MKPRRKTICARCPKLCDRSGQALCRACQTAYMRNWRRSRRQGKPSVFHFAEPGRPCSYWSSGNHIVAKEECRCGMRIVLTVVEEVGSERAVSDEQSAVA
jgi:hypothetical protein